MIRIYRLGISHSLAAFAAVTAGRFCMLIVNFVTINVKNFDIKTARTGNSILMAGKTKSQ